MPAVAGPKIIEVARQITDDIRRRKLGPGDSYLNTAETAQLLRVSGSTVNRALQLLANRGVVLRRQRQGTIVADVQSPTTLRRLHVVIREDHLRTEGLWADGVLFGLQRALAGVDVQFNFRPTSDDAEYVKRLIDDVLRSRQPAGFVLIRSSVAVQRLVAASGLPAVVSGTLQPSVTELPSVERDQRQIGALLVRHLIDAGCRKFLLLFRERITAGDHVMLDAARDELSAAGVKPADITLRCLPTDADAIRSEVRELLAGQKQRVGCLCRSEPLAQGAAEAVRLLRWPAKRRPPIAVADVARSAEAAAEFACVETIISPEEYGAELGRVLAETAAGRRPDPYRKIIPIRLRMPSPRSPKASP